MQGQAVQGAHAVAGGGNRWRGCSTRGRLRERFTRKAETSGKGNEPRYRLRWVRNTAQARQSGEHVPRGKGAVSRTRIPRVGLQTVGRQQVWGRSIQVGSLSFPTDGYEMEDSTTDAPMRYADGEPRPQHRGTLHLAVAALLPVALLATALLVPAPPRPLLLLCLAGKFISYAASAFLHKATGPGRSRAVHAWACKADALGVPVSVAASGLPFAASCLPITLPLYCTVSAALMLPAALLTVSEQERARMWVTLAQFVLTVAFVGAVSAWSALWLAGSLAYGAAFLCFRPVALRRGEGPMLVDATLPHVPWHRTGSYGCHEDFHVLLLLADVLYYVNALAFLGVM